MELFKTDLYKKGFGFVLGVTVGFNAITNDKFMLDCFVGGGNNQGFY
jgi:hypothetical protein